MVGERKGGFLAATPARAVLIGAGLGRFRGIYSMKPYPLAMDFNGVAIDDGSDTGKRVRISPRVGMKKKDGEDQAGLDG